MNSTKKLREEVEAVQRTASGRRRYGPELRARLAAALQEWTASGQSVGSFAREVNVNAQLLVRWQVKRVKFPSPVREISVKAEPAPASPVRLALPCGAVVEGISIADLVEYSRALARR